MLLAESSGDKKMNSGTADCAVRFGGLGWGVNDLVLGLVGWVGESMTL